MKAKPILIVVAGVIFLFLVVFFTIGITNFILNSNIKNFQVARINEALKEFHKTRRVFTDSTRAANSDSLVREVEKLLLDRQFVEMYSVHALDETAKRAETTMQIATTLITSISFVFGLVVLVVGWLSFKKHDELKLEIEKTMKEKSAIEIQLAKIKSGIIEEQQKLLGDLQIFKARTAKTEKSVYTLVDAFSSNFIDLVAALGKNKTISSGEDEALRNKTIEMQYRLSLEHPEADERQRALYGLSALGTSDSIPILKAIIDNREENADIRLLAQQAIYAIEKREAEKRQTQISIQQNQAEENAATAN